MSSGTETLDVLLNKATNPSCTEFNLSAGNDFCNQVNREPDGINTAIRLLAHKIQSPQELESLHALEVTNQCVIKCGKPFQTEVGKFKFLNEIIKVISPKYLGQFSTKRVKERAIYYVYFWSKTLIHESKIGDAYKMLKKQGFVTEDPAIPGLTPTTPVGSVAAAPQPEVKERTHSSSEERPSIAVDEEKSKLLAKLLRSSNPEDLQSANRLIKNMVRQDAERIEKVSKRSKQLEAVNNNVKLLTEMLQNYDPAADNEVIKELYDTLEKHRPSLFRLASESTGEDSADIMQHSLTSPCASHPSGDSSSAGVLSGGF